MQQHFCKIRHKEITLRAAHETLGKEDFTGIVLQVSHAFISSSATLETT